MSRSYHKELLDGENIPFPHIEQNMRELDRINTLLGGHAITLDGVKKLAGSIPAQTNLHIVEAGCGGGDNLRVIRDWAAKERRVVTLSGIDINEACVQFAEGQERNRGIQFIHADYKDVSFDVQPHIIFSSLFCHHFSDEELITLLRWKSTNTQIGFFINDLHRHPLAYHSIKTLTRLFSKSYLVKNDAPLSVLRGFSRVEWQRLLHGANITNFEIEWRWAFRWLITAQHE